MSRPTALPSRLRLVGYADSTRATRRSPTGIDRSRASATANPATLATRSGTVRYALTEAPRRSPSSTSSLKEKGTEMMRPSNSGMATDMATSTGDRPIGASTHERASVVAQIAWTTGTSSDASVPGSQHSRDSAIDPAAKTVVTTASTPARTSHSITGWASSASRERSE